MTFQASDHARARHAGNLTALGAVAVFVLTTVHHAYGASVYETPWRHHASIVAGLATAVILGSLYLSRRRSAGPVGTAAQRVFVAVTLVVMVLLFGFYEGGYNHVVKNALFFGCASDPVMRRFYPLAAYEMPNDLFFEVTGMLQLVPGLLTGYYLRRFVRESRGRASRRSGGAAMGSIALDQGAQD